MGMNGNRLEAFTTQQRVHAQGIDFDRSTIKDSQGIYKAATSAVFRTGQWLRKVGDTVTQVAALGQRHLGMAKAAKATLGVAVSVDLPLTVAAAAATISVGRGSLVALSFVMRTAINMGGSIIPTVDGGNTAWTLDTTTGVLTWGAGGGATNLPAVGTVVYVTYTYNLTLEDYEFDGQNWRMTNDDVTKQDNMVTIITGWNRVFTAEFETGVTYAVADALYVSAAARTTNASGGGAKFAGQVLQLPTNTDRFLGCDLHGDPVA